MSQNVTCKLNMELCIYCYWCVVYEAISKLHIEIICANMPSCNKKEVFTNQGSIYIFVVVGTTIRKKKELEHLTQLIAIIPVHTIERTFGAMHCFKEDTKLPICHFLLHPPSINVG